MTKERKPSPTLSEAGRKEAQERKGRLSSALRDNLAKRKAQQRARAGQDAADRSNPSAGGDKPPAGRPDQD